MLGGCYSADPFPLFGRNPESAKSAFFVSEVAAGRLEAGIVIDAQKRHIAAATESK